MKVSPSIVLLSLTAAAEAAAMVEEVTIDLNDPANPSDKLINNDDDCLPENDDISRATADMYVQKQIEWLKSKKGGFFSSKIMYRNDVPISGIFAKAPIAKGEEIIHLPVELLINSRVKDSMCHLAHTLAEEYRKGEKSNWEPYVSYCFESFNHEGLPANWSDEALELYYYIVGDELNDQYLGVKGSYEEECEYNEDDEEDELLEAAYRIVVARGWMDILVPVIDMTNHRNGKWYNAETAESAHIGKDVSMIALRDIKEGEQIHFSYNECRDIDCFGIEHTFTMPGIFAEYGFVEQYPRRFNIASDYNRPVFELDKDEMGVIELTWLDGKPTVDDLDWFKEQYKRLKGLAPELEAYKILKRLKSHEEYAIYTFYEAMLEGLHFASQWEFGYEDLKDYVEELYEDLEDHIKEFLKKDRRVHPDTLLPPSTS